MSETWLTVRDRAWLIASIAWPALLLLGVLILIRLRHRRPSRRQRVLEVFFRYPTTRWYVTDLCRVARLAGGSIYPELARLELDGWVLSDWGEQVAGPPLDSDKPLRRRCYWLNPARPVQHYDPEVMA